MALVIFWTLFVIVGSIRCERGDNCTCRIANAPGCPCDIADWPDGTGRPRKKLDCANLEGDPLFIDISELNILAEELYFRKNKGIKSLEPDMFRNQPHITGMFFDDCNITSLNASTFENMTRLVKLEFARNNLHHIDAHFATNTPKLRRIETEDNPIAHDSENTCDATYVKHSIAYGDLFVPLCWKQCPIGTFNSFNFSDECPLCPMGKFNNFSSDPNITMQAVCYDCPLGKYGNETGATNISHCKNCSPGQYSDTPGDTLCDYCAPGRFSEASGASLCSPCSAGRFSSAGDPQCTICSAGKYSLEEARENCTDCPAGWFSMNASTACSQCQVGSYSQASQASCTLCPTGRYGPSKGLSSCPLCPAGKERPDLGAVNASQCVDCMPGRFSAPETVTYCEKCKYVSGLIVCEVCADGKDSPAVAGGCFPCPLEFLNPEAGQKCQECQQGRYNPVSGAGNQSQCLNCPEGHFCDNLAYATPCPAGTYSMFGGANSSASCKPCEIGKYAASGASSCSDCECEETFQQELLNNLPILIAGACIFALVLIFVLWMFCKDRKFVDEERAEKKYHVPISAVFGLFNFVSDCCFAASLAQVDKRPDFSLELAVTFLIGPFLLSLACLSWLTCREMKEEAFFKWFKDHAAFASMTILMSATNTSLLELTYCKLGRLGVFQAPWNKSKKTENLLLFVGLLTNLLEDIPQLCLQLYVAKSGRWSFFVIFATAFSVLSLVSGSTKHLFLLFGWCKHQQEEQQKKDEMNTPHERFIFTEPIN